VFENPSWDWTAFDFGADPEAARAKFAGIVNSDDPDLRPFRDRGGKLLMWHGWADQMVPSQATVDYYNAVIDVIAAEKPARNPLRATQSFARLFMNPVSRTARAG
jgi:feruloyl esterase